MLKISACTIVKNEEHNLPRWLTCVKMLADEIVVVDTGSTDRTTELALSAGAHLHSFTWRNDFAAAKNFAIQKARGNWIVFLDADEFFQKEDIPKVKALIHHFDAEPHTAGFICPWINIDADHGDMILFEGIQLRVFRRHPDIRYQGAVHEQLRARGNNWKTPSVTEVRIWHTGYSSSVMQKKYNRNLEILLEEQKKRGEIWTDAFYLADCYYGMGRFEEAIIWAKKALASGKSLGGLEERPYDVLLGSLLALHRPSAEICEASRVAQNKFPDKPDYKADEGVAFWQEEDFTQAEAKFLEALAMTTKGQGHARAVILRYLADIAQRKGQVENAMDYATDSLMENRFSEWALSILCRIFRPLPSEDVIAFLNTIYDPSADGAFLLPILAKNGLHEVCLYYDKLAGAAKHEPPPATDKQ